MSKLKFTNISGKTATMLIYKHIGYDNEMGNGVDGNAFANEMLAINDYYADQVDAIDVRINSIGGDVQDGFSIVSAILNSKIPVNTYIDGMAYSMAGVIALCGQKRYMADYGTFMMHEAQGGDGNSRILDLITNSLATVFVNTLGWSMDKVRNMMERETWMSAEECAANNMFVIIPTGKAKPVANSAKALYTFYNKLINQKPITMQKVTNKLKLNADANEDAIVNAIEALEASKEEALTAVTEKSATIADLTTENADLKAKLAEYEAKEAEAEKAAVLETIENAVKDNKIAADSKETWLNTGLNSATLKNMFGSMKSSKEAVKIFNGGEDTNGIDAERKDWKYADWERKDPKGLLELKNNNPEAFNALVKTI